MLHSLSIRFQTESYFCNVAFRYYLLSTTFFNSDIVMLHFLTIRFQTESYFCNVAFRYYLLSTILFKYGLIFKWDIVNKKKLVSNFNFHILFELEFLLKIRYLLRLNIYSLIVKFPVVSRIPEVRRLKKELSEKKAQIRLLKKKVQRKDPPKEAAVINTPDRTASDFLQALDLEPTASQIKKVRPVTETNRVVNESDPTVKKQLFKEYKGILTEIAKHTGVNWKSIGPRRRQRAKTARQVAHDRKMRAVDNFLTREDNSFELSDKRHSGRFALADTLTNLYHKYCAESENVKVGRSTFISCRDRKKFKTVDFASRHVCLCVKHANIHLMMKAVKGIGKSSAALVDQCDADIEDKLNSLIKTD